MRFDWSPGLVVAGGRCFFGSSADHKIYAIDAATGEGIWEFFTGGPVRLAPAVWNGRVYAVSDDGCLYCLSANDGRLLWKIRAGDEVDRLIGNGRIVSRWAARGGAAIRDGIVYFGAGNWAMEGVYIYAVDAVSGKVVWVNDDCGNLNIEQPHMGAMSEGGVIAQGYLAVTGDKLYVATGRSVPAVFDRRTGRFLYFHHSRYGGKTPKALGGWGITATDEVFFNSGTAFDAVTGLKHHVIGTSKWWEEATYFGFEEGWHGEGVRGANKIVCVTPDSFIRSEGAAIHGSALTRTTYRDSREAEAYFYTARAESSLGDDPATLRPRVEPKRRIELITGAPVMDDKWSIDTGLEGQIESLVVAGDTIVAGSEGVIAVIDKGSGKVTRRMSVDGTVYSLAVADGRLYASTDKGTIYCFVKRATQTKSTAAKPAEPTVIEPAGKVSPYKGSAMEGKADRIIEKVGVTQGYAVDLDCGDGELAYYLAQKTDLYIIALSTDDRMIAKARRLLDRAGVYGSRVQVLKREKDDTYLPDYFANLIVSSGGQVACKAEIRRIQRPYGGVVCIGNAEGLTADIRGELPGAGSWTHPLADPGNTLNSGDKIAKAPLGLLWYEDETLVRIDRHGKNPASLFYEGVMVQLGRDAIKAVDAYNGTELWQVDLPGVLAGMTGGSGVGATASGNVYCANDGVVYVAYEDRCVRLDVFTGEAFRSFRLPIAKDGSGTWGCLAVTDGVLIGTIANEKQVVRSQHGDGGPQNQVPMERMYVESRLIFALDAKTGRPKWSYKPVHSIRNNSIAIGNGRVYFIDRPVAEVDGILKTEIALRRRNNKPVPEHPTGKLIAKNLKTGKTLWSDSDDVYGTTMAYSSEHDILIMSYNNVGRALPSESGPDGARAYRGETGKRIWDDPKIKMGRAPMIGRTLWSYTACDILTGRPRLEKGAASGPEWRMKGKGIGCGVWVGAENILLRRSGTLGYYDLIRDTGWIDNYGGLRSGCWINTLPVGGIVLVPDDTQGCRCSYQNVATVALINRGVRGPDIMPLSGEKFKIRTSVGREVVFAGALRLEITHDEDGAEARYTTDGSFATERSRLYKGPITIADTTAVAASIFRDGKKLAVRGPVVFLKLSEGEYDSFERIGQEVNELNEKEKLEKLIRSAQE